MKTLLWRSMILICLVALMAGCVTKKKKAIAPNAPFGDQVIVGYDSNANPIYGSGESSLAGRSDEIGQDRMMVWKANLTIETPDVSNAVAQAVSLAEKNGGYVESRSENSRYSTTLKLRIPTKSFTNVVGSVEALGSVTSRRVENKDVTDEYIDTDARLKNKIVLRDRLRGLLDKATEVKDILAIETELNRVQGDIDSMEARIKSLKGKVDLATLDLTFVLKEEKPKKILGPLGLLFKGVFWTIEKLFVIRE